MRQKARVNELTFGITEDVEEAHWQAPIHRDDWHMLGSVVEGGSEVFVNIVGTFGESSASSYWSWVAASIGRLTQYMIPARMSFGIKLSAVAVFMKEQNRLRELAWFSFDHWQHRTSHTYRRSCAMSRAATPDVLGLV